MIAKQNETREEIMDLMDASFNMVSWTNAVRKPGPAPSVENLEIGVALARRLHEAKEAVLMLIIAEEGWRPAVGSIANIYCDRLPIIDLDSSHSYDMSYLNGMRIVTKSMQHSTIQDGAVIQNKPTDIKE